MLSRAKYLAMGAMCTVLGLAGCGGSTTAPTLLVVQNVNGTYGFTVGSGKTAVTTLTGTFTSSDPVINNGTDYFSPVTATLTPTAASAETCGGSSYQMTGKVTNPKVNLVLINMTGTGTSGATLTLTGTVGYAGQTGDLGSQLVGTYTISGGGCMIGSTAFTATRM